jgi:hypothetical protein
VTVAFGDDLKKPFVNCQIKMEADIGNQMDERLVFDIYNRKYIEGKKLLYLGVGSASRNYTASRHSFSWKYPCIWFTT